MANNKNSGSSLGCGAGFLGTIFVLLGVALHAILSSLIAKAFIGSRFAGDVACAVLTLTITNIIVAFALYEIVFIVWQVRAAQRINEKKSSLLRPTVTENEKKQMDKVFIIVLIVCIALSLAFSVVNANTFTCLKEDSISTVVFTTTKEYRWDGEKCDVLRYAFACDESGGLTFKITMKDGKVFDLLGGVTSLSDGFAEKYNTDKVNLLAYVADLSEQFDSSEFIIERSVTDATVENAKKAYENNTDNALIWEQIQRIIY